MYRYPDSITISVNLVCFCSMCNRCIYYPCNYVVFLIRSNSACMSLTAVFTELFKSNKSACICTYSDTCRVVRGGGGCIYHSCITMHINRLHKHIRMCSTLCHTYCEPIIVQPDRQRGDHTIQLTQHPSTYKSRHV